MTDLPLMAGFDEDDHFLVPVDGHGNGPVDGDGPTWDHDACSCGSTSWARCPTRLHAAGQPCDEYNCIDCDPDWQVTE